MPLLAHYPLTEDSGSTAYDHSGNGHDGTVNGATLGATGLMGQSGYDLDGVDDRIDLPIQPPTGGVTFTVWIRPTNVDGGDNDYLFGCYDGTNDLSIRIDNGGPYIDWITFDGSNAYGIQNDTSIPISNNVWSHWAFRYSPDDGYRMFKDGEEIAADPDTTFASPSQTLALGAWNSPGGFDRHYTGRMANARVYDHALSPAEIQHLASVPERATLVTDIRTHGSAVAPNLESAHTLNGETVQIHVIGSPGAGNEEQPAESPITLTAATSYSLTWQNGHTDFQLRAIAQNPDVTQRIEIDRLELVT